MYLIINKSVTNHYFTRHMVIYSLVLRGFVAQRDLDQNSLNHVEFKKALTSLALGEELQTLPEQHGLNSY